MNKEEWNQMVYQLRELEITVEEKYRNGDLTNKGRKLLTNQIKEQWKIIPSLCPEE